MLGRARRDIARDDALRSLQHAHEETVLALATALELRDDETGGHARRVTELALQLARRIAPELADDPCLRYGFLLHDIGKIGIPDAILQKPGPLTREETEQMRMHTALGVQLVSNVAHLRGVAQDVIAYHHERWDGTGYPWGYRGDRIPVAARIFAVADAFDAMTNDRPYQEALDWSDALGEIQGASGTQFDPRIVAAFTELVRELHDERTWEPVHVPNPPEWAVGITAR